MNDIIHMNENELASVRILPSLPPSRILYLYDTYESKSEGMHCCLLALLAAGRSRILETHTQTHTSTVADTGIAA